MHWLRRYGNIPNDFTKCMNLTTSKKIEDRKHRKKSKREKPVEVMCPCCDEPYLYNSDIISRQQFWEKAIFAFFPA